MSLEGTRHKLKEADFFLQQCKLTLDQPEILGYYLSAFISAARSVTFVLQVEIGKNHEFKAWYSEKQEYMKKDRIFSFFNSLRVETIHREGKIKLRRKISLEIIEADVKQPDRQIEMYFDGYENKDGIVLCRMYLDNLGKIVTMAEKWA